MPVAATHSVALAISPATGGDRLLLVLRPADDDVLPGTWTLPATNQHPDEPEQAAIRRAGHEKLGVAVQATAVLGEAETDDGERFHRMRVHGAMIDNGVPRVPQQHGGTQYVDYRWADPTDLKPAARRGSLGAQVLLRSRDLPW